MGKTGRGTYLPSKKLIVVVFFVIGLVLIFAYALIRVYWENVTSSPASHKKMSRLRNELKETFARRRQ